MTITGLDDPRIQALVDELDELARMLAMRPDVLLGAGEPGSGWWFRPDGAWINADSKDLVEQSEDFCRGLATHEAGHAAITRIHQIVPRKLLRRPGLKLLINTVEDCRLEDWMQLRMPGCVPWVTHYNELLFGDMMRGEVPPHRTGQFSAGILVKWWTGELPANLADGVVEALDSVWGHLEDCFAAIPPARRVLLPTIASAYQAHPVARAFLASDSRSRPDGHEMLVRMAQCRMWMVLWHEIVPVFDALLDKDKAQFGAAAMRQQLGGMAGRMRAVPAPGELPRERRVGPVGSGFGSGSGQGQGAGLDRASMHDAVDRALEVDPDDVYLAAWNRVAPLIDRLADELARELDASTRSKWLRGYPSGAMLDVRQAMQLDADPERYRELWMRKSLPHKIDPAFVLVLDRSASMSGDRIQHAFDALVLLTEVCKRLSIPTDIWSFESGNRLEHPWDEPLGPETRSRLGRIPESCCGGTAMGDALDKVLERLPQVPYADRIVLVLGDGEPGDPQETLAAVGALESDGCVVVGLGIGADTRDMRRYFDDGLFGVPVAEVAGSLAALIRAALDRRLGGR